MVIGCTGVFTSDAPCGVRPRAGLRESKNIAGQRQDGGRILFGDKEYAAKRVDCNELIMTLDSPLRCALRRE